MTYVRLFVISSIIRCGIIFIYMYGSVRSFFIQAEDGIRYLVRSRGLGDVYKRQMIKFFKYGNWNGYIIFFKAIDCIVVV
mgnify:CR=1 FL=1